MCLGRVRWGVLLLAAGALGSASGTRHRETVAETEGAEARRHNESSQGSSGPLARVIRDAIKRIRYPDKEKAWGHVQYLGRKYRRNFPNYKFVKRGGLSSPHMKFMTDIDLIFNNPTHGFVSPEDYGELKRLALSLCRGESNIIKAKVSFGNKENFDEETQDLAMVGGIVEEGADLVVVTCRYTLQDGWSVPIDVALQRGEPKMSKALRRKRIYENFAEANYAKVVQRVRPLLKPAGKRDLAAVWNQDGGRLRFLAKQLELLRHMSVKEVGKYLPKLHIPGSPPHEEWAKAAEEEMQRVALDVLLACKETVIPVLGDEAERMYDELEAAKEAAFEAAEA